MAMTATNTKLDPERISYAFIALLLLLVGLLHMSTLLLAGLFSHFLLNWLSFGRSKALGVSLFVIVMLAVSAALYYYGVQGWKALPKMVEKTIPAVVELAEKKGIELPVTDYQSLKALAVKEVKDRMENVGRRARGAVLVVTYLIIGIVVAIGMFLHKRVDFGTESDEDRDSLYAATTRQILERFRTFYASFSRVMGAQLLISVINTTLTALFLVFMDFPYAPILAAATFLCGLLPIIGNVISNTVITMVGLTISTNMALGALIFLISIHKLEYFLNSKIIGERTKNPMWLTLIGILLGEKLMGVPGMILAPVVLHYLKVEASRHRPAQAAAPAEKAAP